MPALQLLVGLGSAPRLLANHWDVDNTGEVGLLLVHNCHHLLVTWVITGVPCAAYPFQQEKI